VSEETLLKSQGLLVSGVRGPSRLRLRLPQKPGVVVGQVQGASGVWKITRRENGGLDCECPAASYNRPCYHVYAVKSLESAERTS
jgi:hypothetical protein